MRSTIRPARKGRRGRWGLHRAARWCPIFVRRCTIGVNAKLSWCLSLFKIQPSSDAPRNEFAGGERGDNRGTKCPDPKALLDGIQQRFFICVHGFHRWCIGRRDGRFPRLRSHRVFSALRASRFSFPAIRSPTMRNPAQALRAYPVGVRERRPLHSAFADRAVGKIGRQFSYKHNAEQGVRLDEQRSTVDRGSRGGGRRSCITGCATGHRGISEPFRGLYARPGARAGRCTRIRLCIRIRIRMSGRLPDVASLAARADHRCARNQLPHAFSFLRRLHPDDTAAAHRDGRTAVSIGMRRMGAAFRGKTSMGADGRDN